MKRQHAHLRSLPMPNNPRPIERLDSATILARATGRDDCQRTIDGLRLLTSRQEDIIAELQSRLDEACEDRDAAIADQEYWARRAILAERAQRPALLAGWWALAALGWVGFWGLFETPESRGGAT